MASKEEIDKVNLSYDVNEVQSFEAKIFDCVINMLSSMLLPVSCNVFDLTQFLSFFQNRSLQILNQKLNFSVFRNLPKLFRNVETDCLKEENKADPLVVLVMLNFFFSIGLRSDARKWEAGNDVWKSERRLDPAEGVEEVGGNAVDDTVDGVAEELFGGHQEAGGGEDEGGELVVEPEDAAVSLDVVRLKQVGQRAEQVQHFGLLLFLEEIDLSNYFLKKMLNCLLFYFLKKLLVCLETNFLKN